MYKISALSNGIQVVIENIDYVKSVSVGVWIGAGSAIEQKQNNGVSHFIEHMLFKGTKTRTAKQIAEYMDRVGGQLNAVTAKEYTCYYAKILTEHLDMAFDVLADMIENSTFAEENIATERKVITEEINMCDDTPEDYIHDMLSGIMWGKNALGYPIAGTTKSLNGINRKTMLDFKDSFYCADNMVISVVGNLSETSVLSSLEEKLGSIKPQKKEKKIQRRLKVTRNVKLAQKDIEQCHVCMGLNGLSRTDPKLYDLIVVNTVFGGNMSSRLFQKVREELGLAYSIYSYANTYKNNGSFVIYAGLNTESLFRALKVIGDEIKILKTEKLSRTAIATAKEQLKASAIMGLEGMSSRMSSYGKSVLLEGRAYSMEDTISLIEKVDYDSVAEVIDRVFNINCLNLAVTGKINADAEDFKNIIDF